MKLSCVYVACHKGDYRLAKICIASIRHWHPELPIILLTDTYKGPFSTLDLEKHWQITVRKTKQSFGSPFSKLEPLMDPPGQRFLLLDADTCLVNRLPDQFLYFDEDFILQPGHNADPSRTMSLYFDMKSLNAFDPLYSYPGYSINTGQFFAKSGVITKTILDRYVNWNARPVNSLDRNLFRMNEESILNYLWVAGIQRGTLNIRLADFWEWSESMSDLNSTNKPIIHWAGATSPWLKRMSHYSLLDQYERAYYSKIPMGTLKRITDNVKHTFPWLMKSAKRRLGLTKLRQ